MHRLTYAARAAMAETDRSIELLMDNIPRLRLLFTFVCGAGANSIFWMWQTIARLHT